jgi:hypothetical protein
MDFANDEEIQIAHDLLLPGLPDFDEEKLAILKCNTTTDVKACPGSGKTTTLLTKLVILANRMPLPNNKGICVLTHTNVAIDEIKSKLDIKSNILFNYPNYFGTIQGFIDKFIAIPYFNSISLTPIATIDDEVAKAVFLKSFNQKNFDDLRCIWGQIKDRIPKNHNRQKVRDEQIKLLFGSYYDVNSSKFYREYAAKKAIASDNNSSTYHLLESTRKATIDEGVLKFDDAFAYAIAYAERCRELREAISERFEYLFIDEMQDTNALQYDTLKMLFDEKKVIIQCFGDPYQSIFENGKLKWAPDKHAFLPINQSMRFGDEIAKVLRFVCEKDNSVLNGNPSISSLKPILLVYNNPLDVLPKFVELIKEKQIQGTSIYEISKRMREKDPLHRFNIKAVGWVGTDKSDDTKYTIKSYYPNYQKKVGAKKTNETKVLSDYLCIANLTNLKAWTDQIFSLFAYVLELCNIRYEYNGQRVRFTKARVQSHMQKSCSSKYIELRAQISKWYTDAYIDINKTLQEIYTYIDTEFYEIFHFNKNDIAYSQFMTTNYNSSTQMAKKELSGQTKPNIYSDGNVQIEVATVHSVKGETHVATLYMETSYQKKYESEYFGEQLCGIHYSGDEANTKKALRVAYVAMSRPKLLLCFAVQNTNYNKLKDKNNLSKYWDVITI